MEAPESSRRGSGKSRFAAALLTHLTPRPSKARLLGTDRLREMADPGRMGRYWGDNLSAGYAKTSFDELRAAGVEGSGIDTFLLLEDRMELRIRIEATVGHLFDRDVILEWDSGHLVPKATRREGGESYRLDRDECHGIKELLVLLTHLYDHGHGYLIIDEPELNLHPQLQAFFMQEVRKIAGRPGDPVHKKVVFLITHSPFILDLRCDEDIKSVISFDLTYSVPKQIARATPSSASRSSRPSFAPLAVAAPRRSGRSSASAWRTSALTNAATIFGTAGTRPPHGHEKRFNGRCRSAVVRRLRYLDRGSWSAVPTEWDSDQRDRTQPIGSSTVRRYLAQEPGRWRLSREHQPARGPRPLAVRLVGAV